MSVREIQGHLRDLYGIEASPQLISTVTDGVLEEERQVQVNVRSKPSEERAQHRDLIRRLPARSRVPEQACVRR
jgi:hypothetical protein